MPITAHDEHDLLNHYRLTTLSPDSWPHEHDNSSSDEDDAQPNGAAPTRLGSKMSIASRSSLSKYRNIDRHVSMRSGPQDSNSLVQKDEPDPLGIAPSVAIELQKRGLPVQDNLKLRNRFMLSSTAFSPALFLSQVHQETSTQDLLAGLDHLSQSIEQKSASLKVLVESNFERFVKAKATIDTVYTEMRTQGADSEGATPPPSARRPHSRVSSRGQNHLRNMSGGMFSPTKANAENKKKNALTKESDYGVQGIRAPLQEVAIKAEEVWGPALGGREKEETMKSLLSTLETHKEVFRLSGSLHEAIRKNDFDSIVELLKSARKYSHDARTIASDAQRHGSEIKEADAQQILLTAKMWHEVSEQIENFKRDTWSRLKHSHGRKGVAVTGETDKEEHMELIGVLMQVGVDENPIWEWLHSRYLYLKDKITRSFERSRIEIEIQRRKLASHETTDTRILAEHLRAATNIGSSRLGKEMTKDLDSSNIVAFWDQVQSSLGAILASRDGIVGEVIEYWETAQSFVDGKAQKAFPAAVFAAGLEHLELEPDDVQNLRSGAVELVNMIRETTLSFFCDSPVEELSSLYTPLTANPKTPATLGFGDSPQVKRAFSFDMTNVPPLSPRRGDAWEKFAFWPPEANSLSGSFYLSKLLALVGSAASEMAAMTVIKQTRGSESLKSLVGSARERCIQAVCAAWNIDAERCKLLETWTRMPDRRDMTTLPASFSAFEEKVLLNAQKIAYVSEAANSRASAEVIVPPPAKLLQALRGTFVTSLYKALSGMVENAEKARKDDLLGGADPDGVTVAKAGAADGDGVSRAVDSNNRNVRMLMTLSNIAHLRTEIIPQLISQFESNFSVKLTDESKTIRDVLGQIDARLFQSYVRPSVDELASIITAGITSPSWIPSTPRPTDARPYVYDTLLALVLVHNEVSTTATTLTSQVLSYLLEQASASLLSAFKTRPQYSLAALMQATLDVEFLAQTLNNYTTDKAGEVQSQIYLALDERTDNEARAKLQGELPEMRATLKKLREGTKGEFGCFKRERRERGREGRAASRAGG